MKYYDIRLKQSEKDLLKSLIGKRIESIYCTTLDIIPTSVQVVVVRVEGIDYYVYVNSEEIDYFGSNEDVSMLSFSDKKYPFVDSLELIKIPIEKVIKSIHLVEDKYQLQEDAEVIYSYDIARGIIFDFDDSSLGLEKDSWLMEDITIHRTKDALLDFTGFHDFEDQDIWEDNQVPSASRFIVTL